jgi:hypothetical protein
MVKSKQNPESVLKEITQLSTKVALNWDPGKQLPSKSRTTESEKNQCDWEIPEL